MELGGVAGEGSPEREEVGWLGEQVNPKSAGHPCEGLGQERGEAPPSRIYLPD